VRRPPLVEQATGTAAGTGQNAVDGIGELLHVLAAGRGTRRVASTGGDAVAVAWLASALPPGAPLFVVGTDELARLFVDDPDIHVLRLEWFAGLAAEAPFDLVHVVGGARMAVDAVLAIAAPRATLVVPFTETGDVALTEMWLAHPRLAATVAITAGGSAVVAVVRG